MICIAPEFEVDKSCFLDYHIGTSSSNIDISSIGREIGSCYMNGGDWNKRQPQRHHHGLTYDPVGTSSTACTAIPSDMMTASTTATTAASNTTIHTNFQPSSFFQQPNFLVCNDSSLTTTSQQQQSRFPVSVTSRTTSTNHEIICNTNNFSCSESIIHCTNSSNICRNNNSYDGVSHNNNNHNNSATTSSSSSTKSTPIYQPRRMDVLLGRGRGHVTNPGNQRLQIAVNLHKDRYNATSTTRQDKTQITADIVQFVKCLDNSNRGANAATELGGRFLKYNGILGCWFEVDDEVARLKVSQALRYTRRSTTNSSISSSSSSLSAAVRRHSNGSSSSNNNNNNHNNNISSFYSSNHSVGGGDQDSVASHSSSQTAATQQQQQQQQLQQATTINTACDMELLDLVTIATIGNHPNPFTNQYQCYEPINTPMTAVTTTNINTSALLDQSTHSFFDEQDDKEQDGISIFAPIGPDFEW